MRSVIALALKDLLMLVRVKSGLFFTFVWPLVVSVMFGFVFAGQDPASGRTQLRIVVVDEDKTDGSREFITRLEKSGEFAVDRGSRAEVENMVRLGQRAAFVAIKPGFGERSKRMFYGEPREIEIGNDPARAAESGMIEGLLIKYATQDVQRMFTQGEWEPLKIAKVPITRQQRRGPTNAFQVTFPQGVVWAIIGCVMTFAVSLVTERVRGTFVRLQMAPLTRAQVLGGKALACFASITILQIAIFTLGAIVFGVRPGSLPLLVLACVCASAGFVGFMMMISSLGKTEQAVAGAGWAMLMPMAMLGGAMIPQFVMPPWMLTLGNISPIKWAILSLEGAVWRGFTLAEMMLPCLILLAFGAVCFAVGVRGLREA